MCKRDWECHQQTSGLFPAEKTQKRGPTSGATINERENKTKNHENQRNPRVERIKSVENVDRKLIELKR
jgi:hypothetical protein